MNELIEAKEIMNEIGCEKAFAVYDMKLNNIAKVKDCDENGECLEIEKSVGELVPNFYEKLIFNPDNPIVCPFNSSMDKYLEFSLKNREMTYCNFNSVEYENIQKKINSLIRKYNWSINKK